MNKIYQKITYLFILFLLTVFVKPAFAIDLKNDQHRLEILPSDSSPEFESKIDQDNKTETLIVSADAIDFGPINPTNEVLRKLSFFSSANTLLFISENTSLTSGEAILPDTSCDEGTCTEKLSSKWINPLTFGFGYSLDGTNYYKIANLANNASPVRITQKDLLLKVNVPQTQKQGNYSNVINIVQTPDL